MDLGFIIFNVDDYIYNNNNLALVPWGTNLYSTVGYRITVTARALYTQLPNFILGVVTGIVLFFIILSYRSSL
jgi:hypothetical protein